MSQDQQDTQPANRAVNPLMTFDVLDRASEIQTVPMNSSLALYLNPVLFEQGMRAANALAQSGLLPVQFNGKPAACFLLLAMSHSLSLNPIMLAQRSYIVHGKFGFEAQAAIALANKSGLFSEPLDWRYEGQGETRSATCHTVRKSNGAKLEAQCTVKMAKDFKWWEKDGSMWPKMTDQMLAYRSASFLLRRYAPEVLMGLNTVDELQDMGDAIDAEYSAVINMPEVYDTAAFDTAIASLGIAADDEHMISFVRQIADQNRIHPDKVKTEAAGDIEDFAAKFRLWVGKLQGSAAEKAPSKPTKKPAPEPHPQTTPAESPAPAEASLAAPESKEIECPQSGTQVRTGVECAKCPTRKNNQCAYWAS